MKTIQLSDELHDELYAQLAGEDQKRFEQHAARLEAENIKLKEQAIETRRVTKEFYASQESYIAKLEAENAALKATVLDLTAALDRVTAERDGLRNSLAAADDALRPFALVYEANNQGVTDDDMYHALVWYHGLDYIMPEHLENASAWCAKYRAST